MFLIGHIAERAVRSRLPRRTVRLRLTLIYGGLFLVSGAVLLAITYLLVRHSTGHLVLIKGGPGAATQGGGSTGLGLLPRGTIPEDLQAQVQQLREQALRRDADLQHQLLVQSGIALAIMSVASVALGWLVAGRVLRPLRTMTAATRQISHENLHERLALAGPSDELKDLADTIDGLLARLEAAFDAQRRFVANASHELRTPLAMMRTSVDVATGKPGPVPAPVTALGSKLREGLDRADRLVEGFLALSRAQQGAPVEQERASVAAIVRLALAARQDEIAAQGLRVHEDVDDVCVAGNETLLSQLVANLVDNAVRHNEPHGWMRVATRHGDDTVTLVVESGGPQLDEASVRELAQPFRRLGAERTGSERGVGLGLSIVAAIAAVHGGALTLRARTGGGLQVLVTLPCAPDGARAEVRA